MDESLANRRSGFVPASDGVARGFGHHGQGALSAGVWMFSAGSRFPGGRAL